MVWYQRWRNVFRPNRMDAELDAELQYHVAETVDRLMSEGMTQREALRAARARLGNYGLQKERTRDMNISLWLDATRADVLYGLRQLRKNPGFTAVAVLSLGLGIGANSAMFQLMDAVCLRALPIERPEELVSIDFAKGSARGGWWSSRNAEFTFRQWEQVRGQQQVFSGVTAWSAARFNLTNGGEPRYAEGLLVSGDFFRVLGVGAARGRTLTAADDNSACEAGAVVSHAFWQRELAGDPAVLGRNLSLDGHAVPVIGVTGPAFFGVEVGRSFDVAIPLCADRTLSTDKKGRMDAASGWWLSILGRLKPGVTVESAAAHLRALSPQIMQATLPPDYNPAFAKRYLANRLEAKEASAGISDVRQQYERPLWLLLATAGLVLLIACANLANLLLARATVREREIATRLAIGASRWRLVRQLLAESLLLAAAGAAVGGVLAMVLSRTLVLFIHTADNPVFIETAQDWRVLLFTGAMAVLTCLLFGLLPALRATVLAPSSAMRSGGRSVTAGRDQFHVRQILVVGQVALSLVLLAGALLFVKSLRNLMTTDAGFQAEGVLTVHLDFSRAPLAEERRLAAYKELGEKMATVPGVLSAAAVGATPVSGTGWDQNVGPDGTQASESGKQAFFNRAAPGYLQTMGTKLLAGRDFDEHDTITSPKVAIVNEMFARKFFGGVNPVGHRFNLDSGAGKPEQSFLIVGMAANTKYKELREEFRPIGLFPVAQDPRPGNGATYVLRMSGSPSQVMNGAREVVAGMSPSIGIVFKPFSTQIQETLLREKLMAMLSGGFGLLAGLLSTLGLYGVIAYMVARRRNEIGVRMALGATRSSVVLLVIREAVVLLVIGLAGGVGLTLAAGRAAEALLYGLAPNDFGSLASAGLLLAAVALAASYVPARRAAAIDPMLTLRNE